jgi:DNA-binding NarL/FixJ family response regulator
VLTDLIMPDMGGRGLFREIQAHYPQMRSRVIFVTRDTLGHEARTFLEEADCPVSGFVQSSESYQRFFVRHQRSCICPI